MASNPPLSRTVPEVPLDGGRWATQGMIAPSNPFVDADGTLTSVSFRFLHGLFQQINDLQQRLANAGIP